MQGKEPTRAVRERKQNLRCILVRIVLPLPALSRQYPLSMKRHSA